MKYSPTFDSAPIEPEFIILHATHCSLDRALQIAYDPSLQVSFHYLIDEAGEIRQLLSMEEKPVQGFHAGESHWAEGNQVFESLNRFSVGIELVNLNGNLFSYADPLLSSLVVLLKKLMFRFPRLNNPDRILGHEQVAGFRGKVDPGKCFPWKALFEELFPGGNFPARPYLIEDEFLNYARSFCKIYPISEDFAPQFSELTECAMRLNHRNLCKLNARDWVVWLQNLKKA